MKHRRSTARRTKASAPASTRDETGAPELECAEAFIMELELSDACETLEHYHVAHTTDKVTRFRGESHLPDIYVVSDPEWKAKLEVCTGSVVNRDNQDASAPALTNVPTPLQIARTDASMHQAGESLDPFRHSTIKALKESGVIDSAMQSLTAWAYSQIKLGDFESQAKAGINALQSALARGFQLGLAVAERMRNENATSGSVQ